MVAGEPNLFGLTQYDNNTSFFGGVPPLPESSGWIIVIGFGAFFSLFTTLLVWMDYSYGGTEQTSEQFNSAGRCIKTGLIAVDIVSHWTWAATLLQSSNKAYQYGVSGPFWYASGATIQILLFGILAIEVKRKAPNCHTFLEIIYARWGTVAHLVFLFFALMTNVIVTGMLLLGGSAVITALTGMNVYAAAFLIPIGIIAYTMSGGLKATFISSYVHTVVIYILLIIFVFAVYATSPDLGSPSKVWHNLTAFAEKYPIKDNKGGSLLTMFSKGGFIFGIVNIVGNFGTVFVDQAYWQSAIAAKPHAAHKGYLLGGLMWFCIPFTLATSLGLATRALDLPVTASEAGSGLVPPAAAFYLLGKGGAALIVIMLFMAVTSSGSAELVAVSSLITYDVYRTYINPKATGKQILFVSKCTVVFFGCTMGVLAVLLNVAKVSLGWVYVAMGNFIGSAVVPVAMALMWKKCTAIAAISGAIIGLITALVAWLVYAQIEYGEVTLDSTGGDYPVLVGNLCAIVVSGVICYVVSMIKPDNYDWESSRAITMVEHDTTGIDKEGEDSPEGIEAAYVWILKWGGLLSFVLIVLWPLLALPAGVFSLGYFTFWVVLSMIWGLIATAIAIVMPLAESWETLWAVAVHTLQCNPMKKKPKGSEFSIHGASVDPVKPQTAIADPEAFEKVVEMTSDKV